ncbi:MAG: Crp/Fnr family transcriptional regulator [Candidatus Neomarinimicrobiota bacterium]
MTICEQLSKNILFKNVGFREICTMLEEISYKKTSYSKNDVIAFEGDEVRGQYIMLSGSVRGEMTNYQGKVVKIEDIEGSSLLAPAFIFGGDRHYPVDIIANNDTECIYMGNESFTKLLQMNPELNTNFRDIVTSKTQFLSNKIKFLALQPIKGKIASYLLTRTKNNPGNSVLLPYSQDKLADLFGVTRPSLTRALRELDQDKIIEAEGKKIIILDRKKLENFIQ